MATENSNIEKMIEKPPPVQIDIAGPLTLWLILLIMGVIIDLIFVPLFGAIPFGDGTFSTLLTEIGGWLIYLPGSLILPLIVSLWIGEMVGSNSNKKRTAAYVGFVNAVYTALIYVIAIFIIYLLLSYISPKSLASIQLVYFALYSGVLPVAILLILVPIISALSAARHASE